ncbi:hypothetical protein Y1Q_0004420 [Alligator mississippiensis]|uniref:Uncharacterized protein n=1 Tax=Alligator mississippiensis TaxID=8496 RepID=A0A151MWE2_ALLMI|nr:hypothetical protein Y1Q_0004420 [Alligator mississippiensis]
MEPHFMPESSASSKHHGPQKMAWRAAWQPVGRMLDKPGLAQQGQWMDTAFKADKLSDTTRTYSLRSRGSMPRNTNDTSNKASEKRGA